MSIKSNMEDVYTIKVKTKPDTRNLYPSERRYSASTVSGLAWVHITLAATSLLLACLALVNPTTGKQNPNNTRDTINRNDLNLTDFDEDTVNSTIVNDDNNNVLVLAPGLLTIFALAAGIASIMASVKWYIDRNITWLFIMSVLSTIISMISLTMIAVWLATIEEDISEFYKDKEPFKDFFVVKQSDVIDRNESHIIIRNTPTEEKENSHLFTKRVLSINILIAAFLELLWSILSVKISYKGMRNNYGDDIERRGNCISVVTTIKGNTKKLPRNGKLLPPKPELIEHYPNSKLNRIFLAQSDNGFYLKNQNNKAKQNTETSSEFYKERMINFLNRCADDEVSNSETRTPSVHSEAVLNPIAEVTSVEINKHNKQETEQVERNDRVTPVSWGDTPNHTIYNQNNINFEKIFRFGGKNQDGENESEVADLNEKLNIQ